MNNFVFDPNTKFLDPERTLFATGLAIGQTAADLGAGSGFYVQSAGKIVGDQGVVYAVDILGSALDHIAAESRLKGLRNVKTLRADLEQANACSAIPTGSIDLVILANIIHQIKNQSALIAEAFRMLKTGGKVLIIEWNDQPGPIGPAVTERIRPEQVKKLLQQTTLKDAGSATTDIYHYGLMFIK
jgi:ubiquinone/menaquinone biosynthesis C-methylase UbiE